MTEVKTDIQVTQIPLCRYYDQGRCYCPLAQYHPPKLAEKAVPFSKNNPKYSCLARLLKDEGVQKVADWQKDHCDKYNPPVLYR